VIASDHLNRARRLFTTHVIRIPFEVCYLYDPESLFQTAIQLVVSIFVPLFFVEYIHFLLKPHQNNFLLESKQCFSQYMRWVILRLLFLLNKQKERGKIELICRSISTENKKIS
jgi:hypothetical protein